MIFVQGILGTKFECIYLIKQSTSYQTITNIIVRLLFTNSKLILRIMTYDLLYLKLSDLCVTLDSSFCISKSQSRQQRPPKKRRDPTPSRRLTLSKECALESAFHCHKSTTIPSNVSPISVRQKTLGHTSHKYRLELTSPTPPARR